MIYLDHAATTPMRPGVWEAMAPYAADFFGNSSGIHGVSRRAKNALEEARERIAEILGCEPMEVVFTSGGTESDNLALTGAVFSGSNRSDVVVAATEHEAVLESADFLRRRGSGVHVVGVDSAGRVDIPAIVASLTLSTSVVSLMLVNNETGTVNDIAAASHAIRAADPDVLVHTDAVQAFGSMKFDVGQLGVDMLSLTAHKFGGPKGAGLLYVRDGTLLEPLIHGGGQELGRRSGTHDVAGAVGLATAMELATADRDRFVGEIERIRNGFEEQLTGAFPDAVANTPESGRSPHHLNIRFPGVRNEALLMRLDKEGVAASAGSACQSGAATVSHVLEAMGLTAAEARESVRFSFGWTSTKSEADVAAQTVIDLVGGLR